MGTNVKRDEGNFAELTPREAEIISLRKEGKTYKQIAELLSLSPKTIDTMLTKARAKLWSNCKSY